MLKDASYTPERFPGVGIEGLQTMDESEGGTSCARRSRREERARLPERRLLSQPARLHRREAHELIDGGAEIFFEHGFERVTVQKYVLGADEIGIDLYAMRDAPAALGIYRAHCGEETPAPDVGLRQTAGRHELPGVQGRFYIVEDTKGRPGDSRWSWRPTPTPSRLVFRDHSGTYGEALLDGSRIELKLGLSRGP